MFEMYDILVVDDEPMIRDGLKVALEMEGHRAFTACDGNEAIRMVNEYKPQLVITDIIMPDFTGALATEIMRLQGNNVPVIAMTGLTPVAILYGKDKLLEYPA